MPGKTPEMVFKTFRASNNRILPTKKQQEFIKNYLATYNGAKSIRDAKYAVSNPASARQLANDNLTKPYIRAEIVRLCEDNGLKIPDVINYHKRNIEQSENYSASQQAINTYYDIIGIKPKDNDKPTNQIAIIIEK